MNFNSKTKKTLPLAGHALAWGQVCCLFSIMPGALPPSRLTLCWLASCLPLFFFFLWLFVCFCVFHVSCVAVASHTLLQATSCAAAVGHCSIKLLTCMMPFSCNKTKQGMWHVGPCISTFYVAVWTLIIMFLCSASITPKKTGRKKRTTSP